MDQQLTGDGRDGRERREGEDPRVQPAAIDTISTTVPSNIPYLNKISGNSEWSIPLESVLFGSLLTEIRLVRVGVIAQQLRHLK